VVPPPAPPSNARGPSAPAASRPFPTVPPRPAPGPKPADAGNN
jgi:hypothetical protein